MVAEAKIAERDRQRLVAEAAVSPLGELNVDVQELLIARLIQNRAVESPITIAALVEQTSLDDREIKASVRKLRRLLVPIGSSKGNSAAHPPGYYWIRTEEEMAAYLEEASKQPLDELTTLHRMAKANYPRLAGQLRLTFDEQEAA